MLARTIAVVSTATLCALAAVPAGRTDAFNASRDDQAIAVTQAAHDPIGELNSKLESGAAHLDFSVTSGYLPSVLGALGIPAESQGLVFSQTSAQFERITPANPRAVYFNDTAAVGWVRGSDLLELAGQDPREGFVFYTLSQTRTVRPRFVRQKSCLLCHQIPDTLGVPGALVFSTFQMADDPNAYASGIAVDHRTPLAQRWGGWYVTGNLGTIQHLGNVPVIVKASELQKPKPPVRHLDSVRGVFDTSGYLNACSDVVALMVLEHQTRMTNLITLVGSEARTNATGSRMQDAVREFVDYLLFVDEAPLTGRIQGSCGFAERFASRGPYDRQGRSLRQLDLDHRLMRYPCSYMIFTAAFDALPQPALDAVFRRLWDVLSGVDHRPEYARLSLADRRAVVEILRDTKKNLPAIFNGPLH
jgi:hypothetical protein